MNYKVTLIVLASVFVSINVLAQSESERLFDTDPLLEVTLAGDLTTLLADIGEEREQHPFVITYGDASNPTTVPLKTRTRGNFRRNPDNCSFPPLRLNFAKETSAGTLFEGLDKIKLVTHCQNDKSEYEQYVVQEYLLYRAYNQLTDASFKARLIRIKYEDTAGKQEPITQLGFLIEDEELMAERLNGEVYDPEDLEKQRVDHDQTTLLYLYEYMIGNIDWNVAIHHNLKLVGEKPDDVLIPVPYDFDHAAVIDTEYADNAPLIGTASLRYQLFRDFCRSEKELRPYFDLFNDRREAIYALYKNLDVLTEAERRRALRYYDRFYRIINDEGEIEKTFLRPCQK